MWEIWVFPADVRAMNLFVQVLETLIYKLPAIFGVVSELNNHHINSVDSNEVLLAQSTYYSDPVYVKGMVIMILVSCIILVCIKLSRIDLAYARSGQSDL